MGSPTTQVVEEEVILLIKIRQAPSCRVSSHSRIESGIAISLGRPFTCHCTSTSTKEQPNNSSEKKDTTRSTNRRRRISNNNKSIVVDAAAVPATLRSSISSSSDKNLQRPPRN